MSNQKIPPKDRQLVAKEQDKKKKKSLFKTFLRQGIRSPFRAPFSQIVRISPKTCQKLHLQQEKFQ